VLSHVVKHGEGVPLHLEQLTRSVLSSDVLKLSADGTSYSLTGNLSELALPTSLENAIRGNLDNIGKADPTVKLLIELTAVLGGHFRMEEMAELWRLADDSGGGDESLQRALMIAMKKRVITSISSKGYVPSGRNRKSSAGENIQFMFMHLRILDVVATNMLKARAAELW